MIFDTYVSMMIYLRQYSQSDNIIANDFRYLHSLGYGSLSPVQN